MTKRELIEALESLHDDCLVLADFAGISHIIVHPARGFAEAYAVIHHIQRKDTSDCND